MDPATLYISAFGATTTLAMLILLRIGHRIVSAERTVGRDMTAKNPARRLLQVGQVLGVFLIAASVVKNSVEGESLRHDILWVAAFGSVALALFVVFSRIGIRLLLKARLPAEIERGNAAAGLAAGAQFVATGIIVSHAIAGSDLPSLALSLAFFFLAMVTLHVFGALFRALTTYDDAEQIEGENLAAAISYAGLLIAVSIIVARALDGTFVSWEDSLKGYGGVLLASLLLYPVRHLLVQTLLLGGRFTFRGGLLDEAIAGKRNEGIGALEAAVYVATALSIAHLA